MIEYICQACSQPIKGGRMNSVIVEDEGEMWLVHDVAPCNSEGNIVPLETWLGLDE